MKFSDTTFWQLPSLCSIFVCVCISRIHICDPISGKLQNLSLLLELLSPWHNYLFMEKLFLFSYDGIPVLNLNWISTLKCYTVIDGIRILL